MHFRVGILSVFIASVIVCAGGGFGAEPTLVETLQFTDKDHIIQTLILVADDESLRYNVIASCDSGVRGIDLLAGPKAIFIQPCGKKQTCRLNGSAAMEGLGTSVITARAECSDGTIQKESIRLNAGGKNPKIYLVASLPFFTGQVPPIAASGPGEPTGTTPTPPPPDEVTPKGPDLTVEVKSEGENTYRVTATAVDSVGVDFVEILREKVYLDVELCSRKTTCTLEKTITEDTDERVKFQFKTMNLNGAFSFDEKVLTFKVEKKEQESGEEENAGEENPESPETPDTSTSENP